MGHESGKLGTGQRFDELKSKIEKEGESSHSAGAIAASIGMKKYGKKRFDQLEHHQKAALGGVELICHHCGGIINETKKESLASQILKKRNE